MLIYLFILWLVFFGIVQAEEMGFKNFITKAVNDLFIPIFGLLLFFTLFAITRN